MFTKPCLMLFVSLFSQKICDSISGSSQVRKPWQKRWWQGKQSLCGAMPAIILNASIIFLNWNWNQYVAGSLGLSLFLFIFGETQCWQHGKWEKTNKTEFVVKHQIWEANYIEFQSSCPMCVMVDLETLPSWQISSSDASGSNLRGGECSRHSRQGLLSVCWS